MEMCSERYTFNSGHKINYMQVEQTLYYVVYATMHKSLSTGIVCINSMYYRASNTLPTSAITTSCNDVTPVYRHDESVEAQFPPLLQRVRNLVLADIVVETELRCIQRYRSNWTPS